MAVAAVNMQTQIDRAHVIAIMSGPVGAMRGSGSIYGIRAAG